MPNELLNPNEYDHTRPFFEGFNIYESFLRSILENRSAGRVFSDRKSFALVLYTNRSLKSLQPQCMCFFKGRIGSTFITKSRSVFENLFKSFPGRSFKLEI